MCFERALCKALKLLACLLFRFGPDHYQSNINPDGRLGDQNRGAQMMKKMGWGGAGLGSSEQGIQVRIV